MEKVHSYWQRKGIVQRLGKRTPPPYEPFFHFTGENSWNMCSLFNFSLDLPTYPPPMNKQFQNNFIILSEEIKFSVRENLS